MQAGNAFYQSIEDLPKILPILAQPHLMLLPGGFVPVTIEDNNIIEMVNDAFKSNHMLGIAQPVPYDGTVAPAPAKQQDLLYDIGCMGRITNYSEIGDGSLLISLQGVCRFRLNHPIQTHLPYPLYSIKAFAHDLANQDVQDEIDRTTFLNVFRNYLDINNMQADWDTILEAPDETLINALSIIAPFDVAEKQALLEADDVKLRSETLIALAECYMLKKGKRRDQLLQ